MKVGKIWTPDYYMLLQNPEFSDELWPGVVEDGSPDCVYLRTETEKIRGGLVIEKAGVLIEMSYVEMYHRLLELFVTDYFLAPKDEDKALSNMMQGILQDYPGMSLGFWLRLISDYGDEEKHYLIACLSITIPGKEVGQVIYPHKVGLIVAKTRHLDSNKSSYNDIVDMFESIMVQIRKERGARKLL